MLNSHQDSRWAQRLHFGQCVQPLLLSTWTLLTDLPLKRDWSKVLGLQMDYKQN